MAIWAYGPNVNVDSSTFANIDVGYRDDIDGIPGVIGTTFGSSVRVARVEMKNITYANGAVGAVWLAADPFETSEEATTIYTDLPIDERMYEGPLGRIVPLETGTRQPAWMVADDPDLVALREVCIKPHDQVPCNYAYDPQDSRFQQFRRSAGIG